MATEFYYTVDNVQIMSKLQSPAGVDMCVSTYLPGGGPYSAVLANVGASSYNQNFARDLTVGFDGANWWFGFALWMEIVGSPLALTYAGHSKQLTLTAYTQGNPSANQIFGMRKKTNADGSIYYLIQSYDYLENQVMCVSDNKNGSPVITLPFKEGGGM